MIKKSFSVQRQSLLSIFYQQGFEPRKRFYTLIGLPFRVLFQICRKIPFFPTSSTALFYRGDKSYPFKFDIAKNTQFESIFMKAYENGYEPEIGAAIDLLLPKEGILYDIGANWGHHSFYTAANKNFTGKIYSFEPFPSSFNNLSKLVKQFNLQDTIYPVNIALSNKTSFVNMEIPRGLSGRAKITSLASSQGKISAQPLDTLTLSKPDVMKIDVEGFEHEVLIGSIQTIKKHQPLIIIENWKSTTYGETLKPLELLESLDYNCHILGWELQDKETNETIILHSLYDINTNKFKINLILIPFHSELRFLFDNLLNILALPKGFIIPESISVYKKSPAL